MNLSLRVPGEFRNENRGLRLVMALSMLALPILLLAGCSSEPVASSIVTTTAQSPAPVEVVDFRRGFPLSTAQDLPVGTQAGGIFSDESEPGLLAFALHGDPTCWGKPDMYSVTAEGMLLVTTATAESCDFRLTNYFTIISIPNNVNLDGGVFLNGELTPVNEAYLATMSSIDELTESYVAAGGTCEVWVASTIDAAALGGTCDSDYLRLIPDDQSVDEAPMLPIGDKGGGPRLVGMNWIIYSQQAEKLQSKLGGIVTQFERGTA